MAKYFNSQPHEEADYLEWTHTALFSYFNSQPHEEADGIQNTASTCSYISTHSLTKRLTLENIIAWLNSCNFNSQPHEEAD